MPTLKLIDIAEGQPWDVHTHSVTNRIGALEVLKADLQATADPTWSASIISDFISGSNKIDRANGVDSGHWFRVEYDPYS